MNDSVLRRAPPGPNSHSFAFGVDRDVEFLFGYAVQPKSAPSQHGLELGSLTDQIVEP